jgi:3-methyladenine DNA glycosylase/8-oxoguanine DNA glycosylase
MAAVLSEGSGGLRKSDENLKYPPASEKTHIITLSPTDRLALILIKTVCTINTTWKQTKTMVSSIVYLGDGLFPQPIELQDIGPIRLAKECKLGFRAKTVDTVTTQLLTDNAIEVDGSARAGFVTYEYLNSLKGIGPYSASHAMMLMRDFSTLPVDSEVSAYLRDSGLDPNDAQNTFKHWGEYRFLGYKLKRIIANKNWIGD